MSKTIITNKNFFELLHSYYSNTGAKKQAVNFFSSKTFEEALILSLSDVCLVPANKPSYSRSKQTHIHVTGNSRYFFFSKATIDNTVISSQDKRQEVSIDALNLIMLSNQDNYDPTNQEIKLIDTSTLIKIACRENQESQVQVSKLRQDDQYFITLRYSLYTHDLLIFLKYKNSNKLFAIGIPYSFYKDKYTITTPYLKNLESQGNISIKTVLEDIESTVDPSTMISNSEDLSDSLYQQLVDSADPEDDTSTYTAEKFVANAFEKATTSNRPNTNPRLGKSAIKQNNYKCIFTTENDTHKTFLKPDGDPYMEVHHLIPITQQNLFENKLDTKANLIPICPLCHRKIHHGQKQDIDIMLHELFDLRKTLLLQSGLDKTKTGEPLTYELLKSFYK